MKIDNKIRKFLKSALDEDIGNIDITTETLFGRGFLIKASLIAKQKCILAGISLFKETFFILDRNIKFSDCVKDGSSLKQDSIVCRIEGNLKSILRAERVALNILSHLSGIATYTAEFVRQTGGNFRILDTRKTLPGLRFLEKYAVRTGGGYNHRFNLSEMVLIKDNHIRVRRTAYGVPREEKSVGIKELIETARRKVAKGTVIEVEVTNIEEFNAAIVARPDIIMLDNMRVADVKACVEIRRFTKNKPLLEVSGGVTLANVEEYAKCKVDMISVGSLTQSVKSVDISLEIV